MSAAFTDKTVKYRTASDLISIYVNNVMINKLS